MGRKTITGLQFRYGLWYIDKQVKGHGRICESTGTSDREEAERYLIHRLEKIRLATVYGQRIQRLWREAATKYLLDNSNMPSIDQTALHFRQLDEFIGDVPLDKLHDETLQPFISSRLAEGVSNRTVNIALERVRRVLRLAALKWRDELGMTWLETPPLLTMLDEKVDQRPPYPLSWVEQRILIDTLPDHLARMALYKLNTGCREQEVCKLRWDWEIPVPEVGRSVFLIPWNFGGRTKKNGVKNKDDRLVVLNDVAWSIVQGQRGKDEEWVFPYEGRALHRMNDTAWKKGRKRAARKFEEEFHTAAPAGYACLRIHDLKHTFGRRLRAAGVSFEDRQVLLGHRSDSVTTHYSAAELDDLIEAANKVASTESRKSPTLTLLKRKNG
ncbi:tyrosine-type recombinase/integrase [Chitinimonas arctica]|uniref:Tyrosine-type recombinase/integrase n=1 Tax=Chitinimonas arctica TaxID=2594795 RepID=A0A516SEY6_9NEIS|nr:tyrosine-type recombinase/integrase [Chitinimonas arctica]QDQ26729.1 tyrosine-type recombinase/integrase [Chitinimonas arctica]